tara:strand:+ start:8010 stop:8405 length:396 start_codon:yes stop_codon:yes gene_type:complete
MAAPIGNKYNEIYTLEKELPIFKQIVEDAKKGEYLSIQEAVMHSIYPRSVFYYLCEKFKDLDDLKKELNDTIIAVINKGGLKGDFNPTASIWRMKQLGESDKTEVNQTVTNVTPPTPEELKAANDKLNDLM